MDAREVLYKICEKAERDFNVICYAYQSKDLWHICIDNSEVYMSREFAEFAVQCTSAMRSVNSACRIVFCFCPPTEERLYEMAQNDNLILVV